MRPPGTELLDDPAADPTAVRLSLGNIARANRAFGGTSAVLYGLEQLSDGGPRSEALSRAERGIRGPGIVGARTPSARTSDFGLRTRCLDLLDLGTGAGDIPCAVRTWGRERGITIRTFGLERLRPAARLARGTSLPVALGCVSTLPFRDRSVDVVTLSQVLHHFDRPTALRVLREAARVARRGVVVADLLRSRTAALLFGVGARLLGFDAHTRADGITSIARGYEEDELRELCRDAGLRGGTTTRPGWRVVAWGGAA